MITLAGCGVSRTSVFPPERSDLSVLAKEASGRAYEILGVVQVDGRSFTRETTLVERLRAKAREMGADDVLNIRVMSIARGTGLVRYHVITAEGIAVRWKSPPVRK